jgi:hypothetical protein
MTTQTEPKAAIATAIALLLAGTIGLGGALAAATWIVAANDPEPAPLGAVVDDGSPF